jgi:hypothetical protein
MSSEESRSFWRYLSGGDNLGNFFKEMFVEMVGGVVICVGLATLIAYTKPTWFLIASLGTPVAGLGAYGALDLIRRRRSGDIRKPNRVQRVAHFALVIAVAGTIYLLNCSCVSAA